MPKICYQPRRFNASSQEIIGKAIDIFEEYVADGFVLTLRQLYYQFVSRDIIKNTVQEYNRLGGIINDARLAGHIDWEWMEDRTRNLQSQPTWSSPSDILQVCANQFRNDKWADQPYRVEVWIEKDALAGVFDRVCNELQVPYFSCRGYTSQSEMWVAGQRLKRWIDAGQSPTILHFGDHDPSGIDMSRDITSRLELFMGGVKFDRLALNYDQVQEYQPPPNPAKTTDSRAKAYIERFGHESWELDALRPDVLATLVRDAVTQLIDARKWERAVKRENDQRELLKKVSDRWDHITQNIMEM